MSVEVGTIFYHPITGTGRPWIVRKIDDGVASCFNLDDGGKLTFSTEDIEQWEKLS